MKSAAVSGLAELLRPIRKGAKLDTKKFFGTRALAASKSPGGVGWGDGHAAFAFEPSALRVRRRDHVCCIGGVGPPGPDEAQLAGRPAASFPQASEDYFHDMDNGAPLNAEQVKGRNMWIVWTGGNDRFWDKVTQNSLATFDLLKIITSHPSQTYCDGQRCDRHSRWKWLGAINEPCFEKPTAPDPAHFGLWLDHRSAGCAPDPDENATNLGVKIGQRGQAFKDGTTLPVGSYFGEATGILGLRLFPNPEFDKSAKARWDPERYYSDYKYYTDPKLVRPYRVGMSCGFCHVGLEPDSAGRRVALPDYSNLNSTVGAQYLWMDRVFVWSADEEFRLPARPFLPTRDDGRLARLDGLHQQPPHHECDILLGKRPRRLILGQERLEGNERQNKQLPGTFDPPETSWSPRVLKDGADSVGVLGALNRVYINIGLDGEDWTTHFNPFFGFKPITPILIPTAEKYSSYWRATEAGTPSMAAFLVAAGQPDKLADAPGGGKYLNADADTLTRGKRVFAETCARCHSSKQPPEALKMMPNGCSGANYLQCFMRYWAYTKSDDYKAKMRDVVTAPDFLKDNYLSTDARIPVTLLRTNACSPLGTNAIRGNIWDNFSSDTYKTLPSVGKITVQDPFTAQR